VNHIGFLVNCRESRDLGDALLSLRLVNAHGEGLDSVAMLARMYKALAVRRGLEITVLDDHLGGEPPEDTITLWITGAGAHALLASEAGLHQVTRGKKDDGPGRRHVDRDVVRVEIFPAPARTVEFHADEVRSEIHPVSGIKGRLLSRVKFDVRLFHVPTMTSVHGWSDGSKGEALQRFQMLLRARVDAASQPRPEGGRPPVIRRYRLGPTTLVRDQRSGRHTGRLDQVLEGNLDLFLVPPGRR
jgi:peptide chain release factor 2